MYCSVYSYTTPHNEDSYFVQYIDSEEKILVGGIADGHGGSSASYMCRDTFVEKFKKQFMNGVSIKESIRHTFEELHEEVKKKDTSGCTLSVVVIDTSTKQFTIANVGDSEVLQVSSDTYIHLTTSHRIQHNVSENMRLKQYIKKLDGLYKGQPRLWPGGLCVTRSIGDGDCPHVICEPSFFEGELEDNDSIVLCTDGVWDVVSYTKVSNFIKSNPSAESLCKYAMRKPTHSDDTTVLVVSLKKNTSSTSSFTRLFRTRSTSPTSPTISSTTSGISGVSDMRRTQSCSSDIAMKIKL